ncbi:MAG TPA: hypothetical protein VK891_13460 [Euzebyales bacterium]|nr:hypothetical protein [Euzebyales bacterium]
MESLQGRVDAAHRPAHAGVANDVVAVLAGDVDDGTVALLFEATPVPVGAPPGTPDTAYNAGPSGVLSSGGVPPFDVTRLRPRRDHALHRAVRRPALSIRRGTKVTRRT